MNAKLKIIDSLLLECERCHKKFSPFMQGNETVVEHNVPKEVEGEKLLVTFFDCPHCDKRYYFQLDNDETMAMLQEIIQLMGSGKHIVDEGKVMPKYYIERTRYLQKALRESRRKLNVKYEGKLIYNEKAAKNEILRLTGYGKRTKENNNGM